MEAFDFAGRTKLPRGPHAARGPQLESPGLYVLMLFLSTWGQFLIRMNILFFKKVSIILR